MKRNTKLRLFGGLVLLFNLWLIGRYDLEGIPVLILTFGFAFGYELLVVRHVSIKDREIVAGPEQPTNDTKTGMNWKHWTLIAVLVVFVLPLLSMALKSHNKQQMQMAPTGTPIEAGVDQQPQATTAANGSSGGVVTDVLSTEAIEASPNVTSPQAPASQAAANSATAAAQAAAAAGEAASAAPRVTYDSARVDYCYDQYQRAIAQVPEDAPLGDYAEANNRAQRQQDSCLRHRR